MFYLQLTVMKAVGNHYDLSNKVSVSSSATLAEIGWAQRPCLGVRHQDTPLICPGLARLQST